MSSPPTYRVAAMILGVSAVILFAVGLYFLLGTEQALIGGVLIAAGAGDALIGIYLLGR